MNSYGAAVSPLGMYVRALYDYEADDRTSLSFRQGDIIQVITQLDSGWWDGIINDVRGWFPSNYCAVVSGPDDVAGGHQHQQHQQHQHQHQQQHQHQHQHQHQQHQHQQQHGLTADEVSGDSGTESESEYAGTGSEYGETDGDAFGAGEHEDRPDDHEAAFWIPQATSDGRLFYYNTLTRVSTMDLPLEAPTSVDEPGPRDRMNVHVPDQTRAPPEMMSNGYHHDDDDRNGNGNGNDLDGNDHDDASASEVEESTYRRRRRSRISEGVSPAASVESLTAPSELRPRSRSREFLRPNVSSASLSAAADHSATSYAGDLLLYQYATPAMARQFYGDGTSAPVTWGRLVGNMQKSVASYRDAVNNAERAEFVTKAEDVSDHLRMLLAAGSGTTDNHSGNPSVISTNKALYPHFRDMMSRFSKLVLSSHIAAADWPAPDSYSKCLQEADGVLNGVYGYVEVARTQRGDEIPRLRPGFVLGSRAGGNWQKGVAAGAGAGPTTASPFVDQDEFEHWSEPPAKLDAHLLQRVNELKRGIVSGLRRLDEDLVVGEKVVTPAHHEKVGHFVCSSAAKVVEHFRAYISTIESVPFAPSGSESRMAQLSDLEAQKQRLYDLIANLVITCQTVAGPLSDEWAGVRGDPLEERLQGVRNVIKHLEATISQVGFSLESLLESYSLESTHHIPDADVRPREAYRRSDDTISFNPVRSRSDSTSVRRTSVHGNGHPLTHFDAEDHPIRHDAAKLKKFFGEVPGPLLGAAGRESEETPAFLRLDHEGETLYDTKTDPPLLRGGTFVALVEQLTRHDRLDSPFNNTFLLTYQSFTTAVELFEMLVRRFSIQPPAGISQQDYQVWADKKQKPIRFRVVNILKSWFDHYWLEVNDEAGNDLLRRVFQFAKDHVATTNTPGSGPLMTAIEQRLRGLDTGTKRMVLNQTMQIPPSIVPKNMKKLKFLDIDVTEFARQLTIIESKLYGKIKASECLNKTWQRKTGPGEPDPAPHVKALILHSNQLTNWVAEMILNQSDVKKRVVVIKHFVSVAEKCRSLNNFSTLMSIITALNTASIHRLSRTWAQVNQRTTNILDNMRRVMASTKNFSEYRETLHSANPPCIPFFGVYLTDLTFIEDGIPSLIKKTNLINFAKRSKTAEVIRDIQQYQNVPYPLHPVPDLQDYILSNMQAASDVHEMYDKSLLVEPREREDEKIARLLSESGFL